MGLAPPYGLATHCTAHCSMSVAQGIRGPCGFDVIPAFLPASKQESFDSNLKAGQFRLTLVTDNRGCARFPT